MEGQDLCLKELFSFGGEVGLRELKISPTGELRLEPGGLLKSPAI